MSNINEMVISLLHIDEAATNKLLDLEAGDLSKTYFLTHSNMDNVGIYAFNIVKDNEK